MQIRKEQMQTFDKSADDRLTERIATYLREKQTVWVEGFSHKELRRCIRTGIDVARIHEFEWESSIFKFVALMFRYAPNFDEDALIASVLERKDVPKEERADLLYTEVPASHWEKVRDKYDPGAWDDLR